jgi:uncharacterized protein (TIGR02594 family)
MEYALRKFRTKEPKVKVEADKFFEFYRGVIDVSTGKEVAHWVGSDVTPWCSAFVNWCLEQANYVGTKNALAKSWLQWGVECDPKWGCIVITKYRVTKTHHVGFFVQKDSDNHVFVLGGNQKDRDFGRKWDSVNITRFRDLGLQGNYEFAFREPDKRKAAETPL